MIKIIFKPFIAYFRWIDKGDNCLYCCIVCFLIVSIMAIGIDRSHKQTITNLQDQLDCCEAALYDSCVETNETEEFIYGI